MKLTFDTLKPLIRPLGYTPQEDHPTFFMDGSYICGVTLDIPYVQMHFDWYTTPIPFPSIDPNGFVAWMNTQKNKDTLFLYNGVVCYNSMFLYNLCKALKPFQITQFTLAKLTKCDLNSPLFLQFKTLLIGLAMRVNMNDNGNQTDDPIIYDPKTMADLRKKHYAWQIIPSTSLKRYT